MTFFKILLLSGFCALCLLARAQAGLVISEPPILSAQGNDHSTYPMVSGDGSTITFESLASNLTIPRVTNGFIQIYARIQGKQELELVSSSGSGAPAQSDAFLSGVSRDGNVILFESSAKNLPGFDGPNSSKNIFVHLLSTHQTLPISGGREAFQVLNGSKNGVVSGDGKFLLFESLLPSLGNQVLPLCSNYLYLRNIQGGTTMPVGTNFINGSDYSSFVRGNLSYNGKTVVFGFTTNDVNFVAVQDMETKATRCIWTNTIPNKVDLSNFQLSDDGHYLVFAVSDPVQVSSQVIFADLLNNSVTNLAACDFVVQKGNSYGPQISPNGRFVTYSLPVSSASDAFSIWDRESSSNVVTVLGLTGKINSSGTLVTFLGQGHNYGFGNARTNGQVLQIDLITGQTNLISNAFDGTVSPRVDATCLSVSEDGTVVAFQSPDGNLIFGDDNKYSDIFSRSLNEGNCQLVSKPSTPGFVNLVKPGVQIAGLVTTPNSIAAVILESWKRFSALETNNDTQIILADLRTGSRILVTTNLSGGPFHGPLNFPVFSRDGQIFAFCSNTKSYITNTTGSFTNDLFVVNRKTGKITNVTAPIRPSFGFAPLIVSSITDDGALVAFVREGSNYLYNTENQILKPFSTADTAPPTISPDGKSILFYGSSPLGLWITNLSNASSFYIGNIRPTNVLFSADSKFVFFGIGSVTILHTSTFQSNIINPALHPSSSSNGLTMAFDTSISLSPKDGGNRDVYVWKAADQSFELISENMDGTGAGNLDSSKPAISPNGRYVLFTSRSTNLVPGVTNIQSKVYLRDRMTRTTLLVAGGLGGNSAVASGSFFSPDGSFIFYRAKTDTSTEAASDRTAAAFYLDFNPGLGADSDHDSLDDTWEQQFFGNLSHDGTLDTDGDGATDLQEYLAGTDPLDSQSVFKGLPVSRDSLGRVVLAWKAVFGKSYKIQFKNLISDSSWTDLNIGISISGGEARALDNSAEGTGSRFYQIIEIE